MVKCDLRNCELNNGGYCEDGTIEDGICVSYKIDELRCSECGEQLELTPALSVEYFGRPVEEKFWRCPNGCSDC